MKLGEGGEAFFVFETTDEIPASLQTSPLVSPAGSPTVSTDDLAPSLQEPEYLDLDRVNGDAVSEGAKTPPAISLSRQGRATTDFGMTHQRYSSRVLAHDANRNIDTAIALAGRFEFEPSSIPVIAQTSSRALAIGKCASC